ncbi:MAG: carnitinyl-CoA dehydratase [Alphaproteobacteria bacterium]|nr:carnitinyl-CoA dehydratase [Alphaproteobacteria bacterium]
MTGVVTKEDGKVLEITIDRPKANAIDMATSRALGEAFARLRDDDRLLVGIVTGAGDRFFSAGFDLKSDGDPESFGDLRPGGPFGIGGFAGITELPRLYKPVIAAVNGIAFGGGCEIALASDIVIAADHALFAVPEVKVGLLPDAGGVQRLIGRLPRNIALEMLLTGRRLTAAEALQFGLVNAVVPLTQLMARARERAASICEGGPLAVQAIKQIVTESEGSHPIATFDAMRRGRFALYDRALRSEDAKEGPRAFAAKRPPLFKGR